MANDELPPLIETAPGPYRHYKGGLYEVIGTVRHSETLEPLTLYRALYGERGLWVRPAAMFNEEVVSRAFGGRALRRWRQAKRPRPELPRVQPFCASQPAMAFG